MKTPDLFNAADTFNLAGERITDTPAPIAAPSDDLTHSLPLRTMNTTATTYAAAMLTPPTSTVERLDLRAGQKITLFDLNGFAGSARREIILESVCEPTFVPDYINAARGKWRVGTFKIKGKRAAYHLDLSTYGIVLDGHGHPLILDSEKPAEKCASGLMVRTFSMNACLNLEPANATITAAEVRALINGALYCPESARHCVILAGKVLFPDAAGSHAVISRMKDAGEIWNN